jgi:hypothetical protein
MHSCNLLQMQRDKKPPTLSAQLRQAIAASRLSRYRISQLTGIDQATLSKFMSGHRGLSFRAVDQLGDTLGLRLVARPDVSRTQLKEDI